MAARKQEPGCRGKPASNALEKGRRRSAPSETQTARRPEKSGLQPTGLTLWQTGDDLGARFEARPAIPCQAAFRHCRDIMAS
jgi:hypothetical protein